MYKATFEVRGMTDLMFGKATSSPRRDDETYEAHERRVWPEKVPVTAEGQCYVNPFAVTNSLVEAAKWARLALEHSAPEECWATGPNTGDPIADLVICPGCAGIAAIDRALALADGG